jgi:hypothetical protein
LSWSPPVKLDGPAVLDGHIVTHLHYRVVK